MRNMWHYQKSSLRVLGFLLAYWILGYPVTFAEVAGAKKGASILSDEATQLSSTDEPEEPLADLEDVIEKPQTEASGGNDEPDLVSDLGDEKIPGERELAEELEEGANSIAAGDEGKSGGLDIPVDPSPPGDPLDPTSALEGPPSRGVPSRESPRVGLNPTLSKNQVTGLDFKMVGDNSRITITFRESPTYREVRNAQVKQIVYLFDNTETPEKLQRAYDTSEFESPVALFTLLQYPKDKQTVTKLIIQLRENKSPKISEGGRAINMDFPAPDEKGEPQVNVASSEPSSGPLFQTAGAGLVGKPIDRLEVKNSDVQDVLRFISKYSEYNIVIGDDVTGKIGTLSLKEVPWNQAFTLVLQLKKLGYEVKGKVIRVATLETLKREQEEQFSLEQSRTKVEPIKTVLIPISYANAGDLLPRAKSFMTERGSVDADPRTNTIIIKDIEKVVKRVQQLFSALDTQPPRVSISAKIVEVSSQYSRSLGLSPTTFNEKLAGLNISEEVKFAKLGGIATTTLTAPTFANLSTRFQIGELENSVRTLANPSVSVIANQEASVTQSLSSFIPTTTVTPTGSVTSLTEIKTSLTLSVKPIVSSEGTVFMKVNVTYQIPGDPQNPSVDSRAVNTEVLVENGDTAVIGNIFQNTINKRLEGIPLISKIPIVGFFFSSRDYLDKKSEIIIFLTPKILNVEESFKKNV